MTKQRNALKGRDAALLILIIIGAAVVGTVMWFMRNGQSAERVNIKVDGKVIYSDSLSKDTQMNVEGFEGGYNHVVINDGKVSVTDADCPDKICINSGQISKNGETIVCMPHRLVVEIEGSGDGLDSVAQ